MWRVPFRLLVGVSNSSFLSLFILEIPGTCLSVVTSEGEGLKSSKRKQRITT